MWEIFCRISENRRKFEEYIKYMKISKDKRHISKIINYNSFKYKFQT